jgi:predicted RNase H-like HicB family nuclease
MLLKQAGLKKEYEGMEYRVIFEETDKSVGTYVPDLAGCVAVGGTRDEAKQLIREAIELHIESLRDHREVLLSSS